MSSGPYAKGISKVLDGTYPFDGSETFKLMLVGTGYIFDPDHALIDNAANDSTDLSYNEILADNYTAGFGGAGRKSINVSVQVDNTTNQVAIALSADVTWTNIGHTGAGTNNDTIGYIVLVKEVTADTDSIPIVCWDIVDVATVGTSVFMNARSLASGGNIYSAMVTT